jgi:P27 family predicted phage terminase small subunit
MGRRGPKPTPTKLLDIRGSWRAKTRPDEPQPPALTKATPPTWLSEKAKLHWKETAPCLIELGLLTVLDTHAWAMACEAFAHWMVLSDLIAKEGMILETETGSRLHPALRAEEKQFELYLKISREFGCTPASRVSLHVQPPEVNELDEFLSRQKARKAPKTDKSRFFQRSKPDQAN